MAGLVVVSDGTLPAEKKPAGQGVQTRSDDGVEAFEK
jgi:hypothetical protein